MNTCLMCHSLYVKANGDLPCWDDVGEELVLGSIDVSRLMNAEQAIFYSPQLQHIRQSFLAGKDPHPEFCRRCAVRGYGGGHNSLRPETMDLLHVEASYLCHLSCPQCIPASVRRTLKAPPYHMSPRLLEGLLRQLRREGVRNIEVVHFEGRGDPLMNPQMPELIEVTKAAYPRAFTMVTTHGSYAYKPWIVQSGLDLLRVSIDGAFPKNYEQYRVGGNLATALQLFRDARDEKRRLGKSLQINWKYILFEWNDSDEEIAYAAQLATELDVQLQFVLTHTPGRSLRFRDLSTLKSKLSSIAPRALVETTFGLKDPGERLHGAQVVVAEEVTSLLWTCFDALAQNDQPAALSALKKALRYDPGFQSAEEYTDCRALLAASLQVVLSRARFPLTLSQMAAIAAKLGDRSAEIQLFRRYLQLAAREALSQRAPVTVVCHLWRWLRLSVSVRSRLRRVFTRIAGNNYDAMGHAWPRTCGYNFGDMTKGHTKKAFSQRVNELLSLIGFHVSRNSSFDGLRSNLSSLQLELRRKQSELDETRAALGSLGERYGKWYQARHSSTTDTRSDIDGEKDLFINYPVRPADPLALTPPIRPEFRSAFGGLWTDLNNAEAALAGKVALGELSAHEAMLVEDWRRDGFVILPRAIAHETIDAALADFEKAFDGRLGRKMAYWGENGLHIEDASRDKVRKTQARLLELHGHSKAAQSLIFAKPVKRFLEIVFGRPAMAFQSLGFYYGSQQGLHQDSAFVRVSSPLEFAASWIALEDIQEGSGELEYYPGSHLLPHHLFHGAHLWINQDDPELLKFTDLLHSNAQRAGLTLTRFLPKKGDVLIWAAGLMHGGGPVTDPNLTRRSLVTHYCPADLQPMYAYGGALPKRRLESGGYIMSDSA
jgi:ectoine hydroxylase-related dioxygenase (phytanoyl-CoA dioxygenase family)/molybdenum cofactor biosynthesis enzyme MoaA